jgi:hypothetical protein
MINALFSDRLQGCGFPTEREAIKAAREELGGKAKKNLMFITLVDNGVWSWLSASSDEYTKKLISEKMK